jgi:hypothetical protein
MTADGELKLPIGTKPFQEARDGRGRFVFVVAFFAL